MTATSERAGPSTATLTSEATSSWTTGKRGLVDVLHDTHKEHRTADSDEDAQRGSDDAEEHAFAKDEAHDLGASGTDAAERGQLAAPLGEVHEERIENDEDGGDDGEGRSHVEALFGREEGFASHFGPGGGRIDGEALGEPAGEVFLDLFLRGSLVQNDVNGAELVRGPEPILGGGKRHEEDATPLEGGRAARGQKAGDLEAMRPAAGVEEHAVADANAETLGKAGFEEDLVVAGERFAFFEDIVAGLGLSARIDSEDEEREAAGLVDEDGPALEERHGGLDARGVLDVF